MSALARVKNIRVGRTQEVSLKGVAASTKIYQGAAVCIKVADGYVTPAANTAGLIFTGMNYGETIDNGSGGDGDLDIVITQREDEFIEFEAGSAPDITWLEQIAYFVDDQTVEIVGAVNSDKKIIAGHVKQIDIANARVFIKPIFGEQ